jgi:hypothetical protein
MSFYRIYWLAADGHIRDAENLDCASDQEAIAAAGKRISDYPAMEVWRGTRRVAQLGTPTPQASTGSAASDSRGPMLVRSAAATIREHRRLLAEQVKVQEAVRRTREKSKELQAKLTKAKCDTPQKQ